MKFASVRLIADDIQAVVAFYELVTGRTADWLAPQFAEIVMGSVALAIGSAGTGALFQVADVDAEFARLKDSAEIVHAPKMMPWGNRSAQFRDPEGTSVSLFMPVSEAAKARFASR